MHKQARVYKREKKVKSRGGGREWYYVISRMGNGQNLVNGPVETSEEAYQWGYDHLDGREFEVETYPYYDLNRVNQIVRNRNLDSGQSIEEVLRRTKHKL